MKNFIAIVRDELNASSYITVTGNNDELAQVIICICAIDTNGCMIKFNDFDDFMNFDNVFCLIAPLFDDLPFSVEMHTENHIAIYSVCGAKRDCDFEVMSTAMRYFCTLCGFKID